MEKYFLKIENLGLDGIFDIILSHCFILKMMIKAEAHAYNSSFKRSMVRT